MRRPYFTDADVTLYEGDALQVLPELPDASVDAVVTDPPYGLEFMGKEWDAPWKQGSAVHAAARTRRAAELDHPSKGAYIAHAVNKYVAGRPFQAWCELWAAECLRILKPGGYLLAFGGTRTAHRLGCAIEDAGFEIRDSIAWLYGSGFPKSLNVSKAIDQAAGAEREVVGPNLTRHGGGLGVLHGGGIGADTGDLTAPATLEAKQWEGFGTALKPAHEPILVARKPFPGTVAANVLEHGTGALNIDACRIAHASDADLNTSLAKNPGRDDTVTSDVYGAGRGQQSVNPTGRWPANVALDEDQAAELDAQSGETSERTRTLQRNGDRQMDGWGLAANSLGIVHGDEGGASRFFYTAKAATTERTRIDGETHPTVKPLALMRWLIRLVTPPGGTVLDPFTGSGTTLEAALLEHLHAIGIEREPTYLPLTTQRIHRRRDPVTAIRQTGEDPGLFELLP